MYKALALAKPLTLFRLNALDLPDTIDISGVELGADIEEAADELKERYPNAKIRGSVSTKIDGIRHVGRAYP